jgi:hypothetical protein
MQRVVGLAGLGFEQGEDSELRGHRVLLIGVVPDSTETGGGVSG